MWKLKGMLWTNDCWVLSLRWVLDGYPPTLDGPIGARFFQLYRITRLELGVTEICARGMFFISFLLSNMQSCAIFERHHWSILLISTLLTSMIVLLHIHALHTPMGSRCIPRTAPSVNKIYLSKHRWSCYCWKFNITSVMRFYGLHTYICVS